MFKRNSRYANAGTYTVTTLRGSTVVVTRLPVRQQPAALGVHPRKDSERLDLISSHYVGDATAAWRLCDANDAISPDALATRPVVVIPRKDD
jgi:hypothetical protein